MLALLLPILFQAAPLEVRTSVDRSRVAVGEQVLFTLSASGKSTAAFSADVPSIDGFALVERRERTDVVPAGREITRVYTLELELRAEQVGTWTIGPIRVEQGVASQFSTPETVVVVNAAIGARRDSSPISWPSSAGFLRRDTGGLRCSWCRRPMPCSPATR